jgi:trigger factor
VKVTFPAEYGSKDLAGKDAEFSIEIKELHERIAVKVDEEFAKSLGMESLGKLREAMKGRLERDYAGLARLKLKRTLLDKLADAHSFAVPAGWSTASSRRSGSSSRRPRPRTRSRRKNSTRARTS